MAITTPPEITPYPEAPQRNQAESVFVPLANTFVASLEPRRVEMQALADWMKTAGDYIDTKIADNKTAIDTVYASIEDVNTVADDIANVNTTAANIADVNTAATNIADVNKVAAIDGDVSTVAASDLAVNTVATDIASVNTTAGSIVNVNAVATDIANVNTTATNIADVNTVATDILAVQAAAALSKRQALYSRSLALNPPVAGETLRLDYVNRAYGVGDAATGLVDDIQAFEVAHTFTRGSTKWAPNALGVLTEYGIDEPAYAYGPETGEALGLLIEDQRTRLNTIAAAPTSPENVTVAATAHTISFFGTGMVELTGAETETLEGTGADERVTLTFTPTAGTLTLTPSGAVADLQLEAGSSATSVIRGEGSQVTRAADICARTLGAEFNPRAFTIVVEMNMPDTWTFSSSSAIYTLSKSSGGSSGGSAQPTLSMYSKWSVRAIDIGGSIATSGFGTVTGNVRSAIVFTPTELRIAVNGTVQKQETANLSATELAYLHLGAGWHAPYFNGSAGGPRHIKSVRYFPRALSEAELIAITTAEA